MEWRERGERMIEAVGPGFRRKPLEDKVQLRDDGAMIRVDVL